MAERIDTIADAVVAAIGHVRQGDGATAVAVLEAADPVGFESAYALLAAIWAGLARMARARRSAGSPLSDLDRQALTMHATGGHAR